MAAGSHNDCGGALFLKMYQMSDISLFAAADFTKQPFGNNQMDIVSADYSSCS